MHELDQSAMDSTNEAEETCIAALLVAGECCTKTTATINAHSANYVYETLVTARADPRERCDLDTSLHSAAGGGTARTSLRYQTLTNYSESILIAERLHTKVYSDRICCRFCNL